MPFRTSLNTSANGEDCGQALAIGTHARMNLWSRNGGAGQVLEHLQRQQIVRIKREALPWIAPPSRSIPAGRERYMSGPKTLGRFRVDWTTSGHMAGASVSSSRLPIDGRWAAKALT